MDFFDLKTQHQKIRKEIDEAVKKVLDSGSFINGKEVGELEKEISEFCGAAHAIGLNSGTDALFLSLKALGIREGDEVITSPFTFIATAEAISNLGARPIFVDIEPDTFNIDASKIEAKITKRTKAILPVHIFGQMADMDAINSIAQKHKLFVVEDAAQALGAEYKNKKAGSAGDLGCFSFFPSKNLGALGDGGMIITSNGELAERIRILKNHGSSLSQKYLNLFLGINSRLDTLQAAILKIKLKYLPDLNLKRAEIAGYYNKKLKNLRFCKIPAQMPDRTHIFHQYTLRLEDREKITPYLREKQVPFMIYYPLPLHLQPALQYLGYKKGDFPEAERASNDVISLPIYPELKKDDQNYIIDVFTNARK